MFANFLIGLREGLEASLVVGILVAYLVRTGHRDRLGPIWTGVSLAVGISLALGALLTFTSNSLTHEAQEGFAGVTSILAVCFVTWMIFWMKRTARSIKGELQHKLDAALAMGTTALAVTAFVAVGREGLETAVFIWSAVQATGSSTAPITGALLGLATAVVLGWLLYRHSVSLNLGTFFTVTGAALVVVAAGVLAYGVHDLQEASLLPGLHAVAIDMTRWLDPSSWWGALFKGLFSITAAPSWLELGAFLAYVVPTMFLFFRQPAALSAREPALTP